LSKLRLPESDDARGRDGDAQGLYPGPADQRPDGGEARPAARPGADPCLSVRQSENDWRSTEVSRDRTARLSTAAGRDRNPGTEALPCRQGAAQGARQHSLRGILVVAG